MPKLSDFQWTLVMLAAAVISGVLCAAFIPGIVG